MCYMQRGLFIPFDFGWFTREVCGYKAVVLTCIWGTDVRKPGGCGVQCLAGADGTCLQSAEENTTPAVELRDLRGLHTRLRTQFRGGAPTPLSGPWLQKALPEA